MARLPAGGSYELQVLEQCSVAGCMLSLCRILFCAMTCVNCYGKYIEQDKAYMAPEAAEI